MDKESRILKVIMKRFGSLTMLSEHLRGDYDTTICNIDSDLVDDEHSEEISEGEIEDYILKILG